MKKLTLLLAFIAFFSISGSAQTWLEKVGKKVADKTVQKVEERIERRSGEAVDKGMDKTEDAVKKGTKKDTQQPREQGPDKNEQEKDDARRASKTGNQNLESYSKYDFIPGEKVIFFTDFSNTNVGDFPTEWNTNGGGEVVETNLFPGRWLKFSPKSYTAIWTDELLKLPDNYTIEFDIIPTAEPNGKGMAGYMIRLFKCVNQKQWDGGAIPGDAGFAFTTEYYGTPRYRSYINKPESEHLDMSGSNDNENVKQKLNNKYRVSVWVQKTRIRLYLNEDKLFDLPRAISATSKFDRFRIDDGAGMIGNIRIAVGAPDTRNKLITEGKLVSYGIYFDVNKDVVKPESYGTLKEIAQVLKDNADVKVKIVGHTDSDGDDASNLDLSKRRGAAVKNELVKTFGLDASRLESDGMGEKAPVAKNDTPANKALNRRVEFIKL